MKEYSSYVSLFYLSKLVKPSEIADKATGPQYPQIPAVYPHLGAEESSNLRRTTTATVGTSKYRAVDTDNTEKTSSRDDNRMATVACPSSRTGGLRRGGGRRAQTDCSLLGKIERQG